MKTPQRILLFGHGSFLNKGCEAIVTTISNEIKQLEGDNEITVATFDKENDRKYHHDFIAKFIAHRSKHDLLDAEKKHLENDGNIELFLQKEVLAEIPRQDICVSIGGDNYCYPNNLGFLYTIDNEVAKNNKKLVLFGASIEENVVTPEFIKDIRKFDIVLVRESYTYKLLAKYLDSKKLLLGPDIAFSLEAHEIVLPRGFEGAEDIVGLNLSPLILNYQSKDSDTLSSAEKLVDYILGNYEYKVALIPHVYLSGGNDLEILRKIKSKYADNDRVILVDERIYSCNELKYIISKCRFLIASRTHASIAGYSSLVPTLVLGYSIKSKGIAKDIFGEHENYVLPVQDVLNEDKLLKKFEHLLKNEIKIKDILIKEMPRYLTESKQLFKRINETLLVNDEENVTKREKCTGCSACTNSCPKSAIEMKPDAEGFYFPYIERKSCINCNLCREICPSNKNYSYKYNKLSARACKGLNGQTRIESSSGGIFSILAEEVINQGGCIFGAAYSEKGVSHIKVDNLADLIMIRGSKYVQSNLGSCFKEAKKELINGRKVLFSGTPCQLEGLRSFLGRDFDGLLCVSVVCHGVPSEKVFKKHLEEIETENGDKIVGINFRNKDSGWKNYKIEYVLEHSKMIVNMRDDLYMKGFLENYYLRQSCYDCDFRLYGKNTADIILGDFWGVEKELCDFDDDKGVSAVILNSDKGVVTYNKIVKKVDVKEVNVDQIIKHNTPLTTPVKYNLDRFEFFRIFNKLGLKFTVNYFKETSKINELLNIVTQSEEAVAQARDDAKKLQSEMSRIINSRRWRVANKISNYLNNFLPVGSQRRKIVSSSYRAIRELSIRRATRDSEKSVKLIMTLLVRDEADIIRQNIEFHLNHGVDFIIATDNGSKDGTRDVLMEFQKKGVLHLIDEKKQDHSQSTWVNRMAEIAFDEYEADIIFHNDADEFWYPLKGSLKTEILNSPTELMLVEVAHVLLLDKGGKESFPKDTRYAVIEPIIPKDSREDSKNVNYYLLKNPPKVIFKTNNGTFHVVEGNHGVTNCSEVASSFSKNIRIYHFPLRNKKQFFEKVERSGKAINSNSDLGDRTAWHWRRWYESYSHNTLESDYNKLLVTEESAEIMKQNGMIQEIDFERLFKQGGK